MGSITNEKKPATYYTKEGRRNLEREVRQKISKLSTEKLVKVNQFIGIIEKPEKIDYDTEKAAFLNTYKKVRTRHLYGNALSRWEEFRSFLLNKNSEIKLWEIGYAEMKKFINYYEADSTCTIIRDFSVFFLFHNHLEMIYKIEPYPLFYKDDINKQLRNTKKTSQPKIEDRRSPSSDEIEKIYEELNKRIEKLSTSKPNGEIKRLNKTRCTLFVVKMARSFFLLPRDFENLRIEMDYLVNGDKKLVDLNLYPDIKNLAEIWIDEMGYLNYTWLAIIHTQIKDRVRKLTKAMKDNGDLEYAWTLIELANPKNKK